MVIATLDQSAVAIDQFNLLESYKPDVASHSLKSTNLQFIDYVRMSVTYFSSVIDSNSIESSYVHKHACCEHVFHMRRACLATLLIDLRSL